MDIIFPMCLYIVLALITGSVNLYDAGCAAEIM